MIKNIIIFMNFARDHLNKGLFFNDNNNNNNNIDNSWEAMGIFSNSTRMKVTKIVKLR